MKTLFALLVFATLVLGKDIALFASVKGLDKNDTLNVRSQAHHKAKKVGEIPAGFTVGVKHCKRIKSSIWCAVYPLTQVWSEHFGGEDKGWVNARYLTFRNKGYVLIDDKGSCAYAISCKDNICEVVTDYELDSEHNAVIKVETKYFKRSRLKGESNFGAMNSNEDGLCNTAMFVNDYLKKERKK